MFPQTRIIVLGFLLGCLLTSFGLVCRAADGEPALERGFRQPPDQTKPWVYWYWMSDNISREGITRDLEAMARVGIGEAFIGNIFLEDIPLGDVKVLTEPWWELVEHAIREAGRVGVNIGMFNCPGWSQSGGPWIEPGQAMRYLVSSEMRVRGPAGGERQVPAPAEPFQDVAVIAFPAPQSDAESLASYSPQVTCTPFAAGTEKVVDGRLDTAVVLGDAAKQDRESRAIEITLAKPLTARSCSLVPSESAWAASCELQAADAEGVFQTVRRFRFDRSNMEIHVGPMPRGPVTVSFPPVTARRFRLVLAEVTGTAALAEIDLSPAARVESFVEKQLGKMHPTPQPMWDTYLWPAQTEPDQPALCVGPDSVIDLTNELSSDGTLRWDVPPGEWVVLRMGMTTTGTRNSPASPEGQGLEVDKMNRLALKSHFDAFMGKILRRMPPADRVALTHVVADSYEMGSQNWTDGLGTVFRDRYGYDPTVWLPVLTGRIVGSADQSNRFLWDLRRLVADRIATEYVGGLRDLCRPQELQLWLENYGHWGFPAEFLQYGGQSDRLGGEFWITGNLGAIECRAASSAANIYGFPFVSSEAFTGGPPFRTVPAATKARGDWAFCEGINHFVLHVYIHQPWQDRRPGINAWFGTEFNRHNTWFDAGRDWIDYLRRCCFLLQQGTRAADVAYFIGEDTPKMTGVQQPELPAGRDFDYVNAEVIQDKFVVQDALLSLPHGTTYRVLVLPDSPTMRPELLSRIRDLVADGGTVLGRPPSRSPSLQNYPACDQKVRELAAELWGSTTVSESGEHRLGRGRVVWGRSLNELFDETKSPPDFHSDTPLRFSHRKADGLDVYFVANPKPQQIATTATFRVRRRAPELWWPISGRTEQAVVYDVDESSVRLPLQLGPHGSVFVVFRDSPVAEDRLVSVHRNGERVLDAKSAQPAEQTVQAAAAADITDNFTIAVWAKPAADTTLHEEVNRGVRGMSEPRNDALFPPHGSLFGNATHAGSGLAIGRNGVCVFEHGASYFAPVLVYPARLDGWVHLAVVYRDSQPSLYVNGRLVHTGLKSTLSVHPGISAQGDGADFVGELSAFTMSVRAMTPAEIAALAQSMPRPDARPQSHVIEFLRDAKGGIDTWAWLPGDYEFEYADARRRKISVPAVPAPAALTGPWQVRFAPGSGAPANILFDKLEDWSRRPEEGIRHYSGTATYRTTFQVPREWEGRRLCLDLGKVCDLAAIRVNDQPQGTLWLAPWRVDITTAARPGINTLEIDIVNAWNNRLVGDVDLPSAKRQTFLSVETLPRDAPLLPAGLFGPVTLEAATRVDRL